MIKFLQSILNNRIWIECKSCMSFSKDERLFFSLEYKCEKYKLCLNETSGLCQVNDSDIYKYKGEGYPIQILESTHDCDLPLGMKLVVLWCYDDDWEYCTETTTFNQRRTLVSLDSVVHILLKYTAQKFTEMRKFSFMTLFPYEFVELESLKDKIIKRVIQFGVFSYLIETVNSNGENYIEAYSYINSENHTSVEDIIQPDAATIAIGSYYHTPNSPCVIKNTICKLNLTKPQSYFLRDTLCNKELRCLIPKELLKLFAECNYFKLIQNENIGNITKYLPMTFIYAKNDDEKLTKLQLQLEHFRIAKINQSVVNVFVDDYLPKHYEV